MDLDRFKDLARARGKDNKKFLDKLRKKNPRLVDEVFHAVHDEVFQGIDCLTCANCCKTTSPIFYQTDIERISKYLHMRPGDFIEQYLRVDEDNDFVLKTAPCPFLDENNFCSVYEVRPRACREYPHTDRKKMVQIMDLTFKNSLVCPAVLEMIERLKNIEM
jgi:Fe-S-cluster containining protein